MIFLWGLEEDEPMNMAHNELRKMGANVFYLDHRDVFHCDIENAYSSENGLECIVYCRDRSCNLRDIKAAYYRPYDFRQYKEVKDKPSHDAMAVRAAGFEIQLIASLEALDAFIINKMLPSATNNSKPLQLSLIQECGFKIPETCITNDSATALAFIQKHEEVVFKSVSGVRSIVEKVSLAHLAHLSDVQWCPTLFQKVVAGFNYRVHVINSDVHAVRIESDALDYRYGNTTMTPESLPLAVAERCIQLNKSLGLNFSGIDLMRTPADDWYCFEVNPSPAYSYFQLKSGLPISKFLAKALLNNKQYI